MNLKTHIKRQAKSRSKDLIVIRRHLHAHPELSFQEKDTSKFVKEILDRNGISYTDGWVKHGIVASIKGTLSKSTKVVALRGDMDALPILEKNNVPYVSKNEGVMHACGHDVHTTCVLGAALILNEIKEQWSGTVKIVFQPGEEKLPGGASLMIKEKALGKKLPHAILAQHVHPPLEVGKVGFRSGKYMASADEIYITVKGKGGHAALPHNFIDPIVIAAQIINNMQTVISRHSDPKIPSVLSFGKIYSDGGATNVIPEQVHLEGTLRTMDETNRTKLQKAIKKIAQNVAAGLGGTCKVNVKKGYPCLINDEVITRSAKQYAIEYLGAKNVVDLPIRLTAEDFSYFSQLMPACFYRLGVANPKRKINSPVHTATFDVDEKCLEIGTGLMAYQAVSQLHNTL